MSLLLDALKKAEAAKLALRQASASDASPSDPASVSTPASSGAPALTLALLDPEPTATTPPDLPVILLDDIMPATTSEPTAADSEKTEREPVAPLALQPNEQVATPELAAQPPSETESERLAQAASRFGQKKARPAFIEPTLSLDPAPMTTEPDAAVEPVATHPLVPEQAPTPLAVVAPTPPVEAPIPPSSTDTRPATADHESPGSSAAARAEAIKAEQAAAKQLLASKQAATNTTPATAKRRYLLLGAGIVTVVLLAGGYVAISMLSAPSSTLIPPQSVVTPLANTSPTPLPAATPPQSAAGEPPPTATPQSATTTPAPASASTAAVSATAAPHAAESTSRPGQSSPPVVNAAPAAPKVAIRPPSSSGLPAQGDPRQIHFSKQSAREEVPKAINDGWNAYQSGDYEHAALHYKKQLAIDPQNRDALLGLAAIAGQQGNKAEAEALYRKILAAYPRDTLANAALAALDSSNDAHSERRLLQSLEDAPNPATAAALGNLYARQQRWSDAQQYYFRAFAGASTNPDYAYNLAVSLDHLAQPRLAADYYAKALGLPGASSFDRNLVQKRLDDLRASEAN